MTTYRIHHGALPAWARALAKSKDGRTWIYRSPELEDHEPCSLVHRTHDGAVITTGIPPVDATIEAEINTGAFLTMLPVIRGRSGDVRELDAALIIDRPGGFDLASRALQLVRAHHDCREDAGSFDLTLDYQGAAKNERDTWKGLLDHAAREVSRFAFRGVAISISHPKAPTHQNELEAHMVSTDGERLLAVGPDGIRAGARGGRDNVEEGNVIIPRHALEIACELTRVDGAGALVFNVAPDGPDKLVGIRGGWLQIVTKADDGAFPRWQAVIPDGGNMAICRISPARLVDALKEIAPASKAAAERPKDARAELEIPEDGIPRVRSPRKEGLTTIDVALEPDGAPSGTRSASMTFTLGYVKAAATVLAGNRADRAHVFMPAKDNLPILLDGKAPCGSRARVAIMPVVIRSR